MVWIVISKSEVFMLSESAKRSVCLHLSGSRCESFEVVKRGDGYSVVATWHDGTSTEFTSQEEFEKHIGLDKAARIPVGFEVL